LNESLSARVEVLSTQRVKFRP